MYVLSEAEMKKNDGGQVALGVISIELELRTYEGEQIALHKHHQE